MPLRHVPFQRGPAVESVYSLAQHGDDLLIFDDVGRCHSGVWLQSGRDSGQTLRVVTPRTRLTPAASNPAIALWLRSKRLVAVVSALGALDLTMPHPKKIVLHCRSGYTPQL